MVKDKELKQNMNKVNNQNKNNLKLYKMNEVDLI
jgi:hypothetical protein